MKKKIFGIFIIPFLSAATITLSAQVGVNTETPQATLDVTHKTSVTAPEGIIAPRMTVTELNNRSAKYTSAQHGAIVYVTDYPGTANTQTSEIDKAGYYYFDSTKDTGNGKWVSFGGDGGKTIWYEVANPGTASTLNTDNSYLNAKAVVGGAAMATVNTGKTAQLTVIGGDAVVNGITVGTGNFTGATYPTNAALGLNALMANASGDDNVAIGKWALSGNTGGSSNTAVGSGTLNANTAGTYNTAVGAKTLGLNKTGINNTGLGGFTLVGLVTGNENTAVGYNALPTLNGASNNTAVGTVSLGLSISGANNTAVGHGSLYALTTGSGNVALGYNAGNNGNAKTVNNTVSVGNGAYGTGNNTVAVGNVAYATADNVVAVGNGAHGVNIDATAIGVGASAGGEKSIAIGSTSKETPNSASTWNEGGIAIGGAAVSQGVYSVAIGQNALTTGYTGYSVAVGPGANTLTPYSVAIGDAANAAGGDGYSVAVGPNSVASNYSVALGAGATTGTTTYTNTALGNGAVATGGNSIALGNGAQATTGANSIAIGNAAVNTTANTTFIKNNTTIVGNTNSPDAQVTLQAIGEPTNAAKADGLLIPQLSYLELQAKENNNPLQTGTYRKPQHGTQIFVTDGDANAVVGTQTEYVTLPGFYYFDFNLGDPAGVGRWVRSGQQKRLTHVYIAAGGKLDVDNGLYTSLQEAYNYEARKVYNQSAEVPVTFHYYNDVGGLKTDGSIPYIRIQSETATAITGNFDFKNTFVDFVSANGNPVSLNYASNANGITSGLISARNSYLSMAGSTLNVPGELYIDNSSFYALSGSTVNTGKITAYSGYLTFTSGDAVVNLTASDEIKVFNTYFNFQGANFNMGTKDFTATQSIVNLYTTTSVTVGNMTFHTSKVDLGGKTFSLNLGTATLAANNSKLYIANGVSLETGILKVDHSTFDAYAGNNTLKFGQVQSIGGSVTLSQPSGNPTTVELTGKGSPSTDGFIVCDYNGSIQMQYTSSVVVSNTGAAATMPVFHVANAGKVALMGGTTSDIVIDVKADLAVDFDAINSGQIFASYVTVKSSTGNKVGHFAYAVNNSALFFQEANITRTLSTTNSYGLYADKGSSISLIEGAMSLTGSGGSSTYASANVNSRITIDGTTLTASAFGRGLEVTKGASILTGGAFDTSVTAGTDITTGYKYILGTNTHQDALPTKATTTGAMINDSSSDIVAP